MQVFFAGEGKAGENKNLSVLAYAEVFWWARVDCASRASKKAPQGLFSPPDCSAGRCCSNPPLRSFCTADKTETPVPGSDTGVFGGRGWITRAALLKTAHWAVFAPSSATAPQLFESTRSMSLALLQNKNLSVFAYVEVFWWARVDYASRASKKAPQGLFSPPNSPAGRCCSNPPLHPFCIADKTETPVPGSDTGVLGGRGWIRTTSTLYL